MDGVVAVVTIVSAEVVVDGVAVVVTIVSTEKLSLSILVLEFLSIVKLNLNFFIPDPESQSCSMFLIVVFPFGFSEHVILLFFMLSRSSLMRKSLKEQSDSNFPLVTL